MSLLFDLIRQQCPMSLSSSHCNDITTTAHVATPYEPYPHTFPLYHRHPHHNSWLQPQVSHLMPLRIAQRSPKFCVHYICYSYTHVLKTWHLARNHHRPKASCVIVGIQIRPNRGTFCVPSEDTPSRLLLKPSPPHQQQPAHLDYSSHPGRITN